MYGALEVRHLRGPLLVDHDYVVRSEVVAVGRRPTTEYLCWTATASNAGNDVMSMRMMSRYLSSP